MLVVYSQRVHMVRACFGPASILDEFIERYDVSDYAW